mgnify:CR=1 FL=1
MARGALDCVSIQPVSRSAVINGPCMAALQHHVNVGHGGIHKQAVRIRST